MVDEVRPTPSTLNPQPSTLNPQPSTLNPQPSTLNPQLSILNPQPPARNNTAGYEGLFYRILNTLPLPYPSLLCPYGIAYRRACG